jgi:hypothetical protein
MPMGFWAYFQTLPLGIGPGCLAQRGAAILEESRFDILARPMGAVAIYIGQRSDSTHPYSRYIHIYYIYIRIYSMYIYIYTYRYIQCVYIYIQCVYIYIYSMYIYIFNVYIYIYVFFQYIYTHWIYILFIHRWGVCLWC